MLIGIPALVVWGLGIYVLILLIKALNIYKCLQTIFKRFRWGL